jgi:hypothetical protein
MRQQRQRQRPTADQLALQILLQGGITEERRQALLTQLARQVARATGGECPESVEDNGATRASELTYLCTRCGHQWDAAR